MDKIRAIYIGDVRFNQCPVFELKQLNDKSKFVMLEDKEFVYDPECILEDDNWIVFEVIINDKTDKEIDGLARKLSKKRLKQLLSIINKK